MHQQAPELADRYRKDEDQERFLVQLNDALQPHEVDSYRDLPETCPTLHIVGPPRSGTTFLNQLICHHLDVGYVNNLVAAFWRAPVHGIRLSRKLLSRPEEADFRSDYGRTAPIHGPHEFGYFWASHLRHENMDQRPAGHAEQIDWQEMRRTLINMTHAFARPMVFKSFHLVWYMHRLQQVLPRTCFVRLRRDPIQNAVSLLKARREYLNDPRQWLSLRPLACADMDAATPVEQVAAQVYYIERWIDGQLRKLRPGTALELSYESVCRNPAAAIAKVRALVSSQGPPIAMFQSPDPSCARQAKPACDAALAAEFAAAFARLVERDRERQNDQDSQAA